MRCASWSSRVQAISPATNSMIQVRRNFQCVTCFTFTRYGICCVPAIFERRRGRPGSKISGRGQLAEVAAYFKCGNLPAQACLAIAPVLRVWFDAQRKSQRRNLKASTNVPIDFRQGLWKKCSEPYGSFQVNPAACPISRWGFCLFTRTLQRSLTAGLSRSGQMARREVVSRVPRPK